MGAAASLSARESADAVSNALREVSQAKLDNPEHAAMLAQHVFENFAGIDEMTHTLTAEGEAERGLQMCREVVAISDALAVHAPERVRAIAALVTVLLVLRSDEGEIERWVNQGYSIAAEHNPNAAEFVQMLMCYYALRKTQRNDYDAAWALEEIRKHMDGNERNPNGYSVKRMQYHLENIALIYAQAHNEDLSYPIKLSLHALLQEEEEPPSCPTVAPTMLSCHESNQVASSPAMQTLNDEATSVGAKEKGGIGEGAGLLFELVPFCEAGDEGVDQAVQDALFSCKGGDLYETLLAINNHGDSLLMLAVKEKKEEVVNWLLKAVEHSPDLKNEVMLQRSATGLTPLHIACRSDEGSFAIVDTLLSHADKSVLYDQDRRGCCPIHYAAAAGDADILADLILHGAAPSQQDAKGFLPVDYCHPTNLACLNLLLSPSSKQEDEEKKDEWETRERLDGSGTFQFNPGTGEARVQETSSCSGSSDDKLLQRFFHTAASLGLQRLLASQRDVASSFAIGQAKARLHLLQGNERTKASLMNTLSNRDATISGLEEHLKRVVEGRNVDAARLEEALRELAEARAAKQELGELEQRVAAQEEDIDRLTAGLHSEQDLRQQATTELVRVMNDLSSLQTHLREKEEISAEQEAQLRALEEDKAGLHARIASSSAEIDAFEKQIKELMRDSSITAKKLDDLEQELRAEQRLKLKAASKVDDLQTKLDSSQAEILSLRQAAAQHQSLLDEARLEIERERQRREEEEALRKQAADRERQLREEAEKREKGMAFRLDAASGEMRGLQERLAQERKQKQDTTAALEDVTRRLEAMRHGTKRSQEEMDSLLAEKSRLGGQLSASNEQISSLDAQLGLAKSKLEEMKEEVERTRKRLAEEERSRLEASAKVEALEEKLRALEEARQLEDVKHKMHHRQEEAKVASLAAERAELKRQLDEARAAKEAQAAMEKEAADRGKKAEAASKENEILRRRLKEEQKWREEAMAALAQCKKTELEQRKKVLMETKKEMEGVKSALEEERKQAMQTKKELARVKQTADEHAKKTNEEKSRTQEELNRAKELEENHRELRERLAKLEAAKQEMEVDRDKLYEEYVEEQSLRKQYFNEIEDLKGRIRVFCRCRPPSKTAAQPEALDILSATACMLREPGKNGRNGKETVFSFDRCFSSEASQAEVFDEAKRLVQSSVDGYNVCVFAYGQSGVGKTYTLYSEDDGKGGEAGIAERSVTELFRLMDRHALRFNFQVSMYVLEIHRNELIDLLRPVDPNPPPQLTVHLDPQGVVYVENVTKSPIANADEAIRMLTDAAAKRKTVANEGAPHSSRSHFICSLMIRSTCKSSGNVANGKLTIVDLASSGNTDKLAAQGKDAKEAKAINKSLLALGDVIQALTTGDGHVPYRNNLLTQLMADSIGGNSKTLMFVCVSPDEQSVWETKESLRWANRVQQVNNCSAKIVQSKQISALKAQVQRLKNLRKATS